MEVSAKDQDQVRNGIVSLKAIINRWYWSEKIAYHELDEAFAQLKRIDMVCNGNRCEKLDS